MKHASLFSGIGGPEVAAAMLGWENAFHCEINPFGRHILEYWFPDSVSYEDITKTDFTEWRGKIDVLTGGFPCQPFSYAGKRGGAEDERYLWPEMLRAIDEIRPTWVVGENVAGLRTMVEGGILTEVGGGSTLFEEDNEFHGYELEETFTIERICRDLERLGYSVQPMLIPAAAVGAPHRRDRIFILAYDAHNSDCDGPRREKKGGFPGREDSVARRICGEIRADATNTPSDGRHGNTREDGEERCVGADGKRSSAEGSNGVGLRGKPGIFGEQFSASDTEDLQRDGSIAGHEGEPGRESVCESGNNRWPGLSSPSTDSRGLERTSEGRGEGAGDDAMRCDGDKSQDVASDPICIGRRSSWKYDDGESSQPQQERCGKIEPLGADSTLGWWREFPTQPPVHRGNDGLPFNVDDLSIPFSKWRTESLKAYGNAIVPQVMYQIFKAIGTIKNR